VERALIGRDAELAAGGAALERVLGGRGALLLFSGEAGIGKTALADTVAASAEAAGATVVWGRCWESGEAPAYWPWTQVFRGLGVDDPFADVVSAEGGGASDIRFRVFDRAAERLRARALEGPLVIVLDDLHAADVPSLVFLQLVARTLRAGTRIGIVATYREAEARIAGERGALLSKIAREGESVAPARLTASDVARLVKGEQPGASDEAIARVHAISEGNPLFVRELLRVRSALDAASLPDGLRAVLEEHLARVPADTRTLLTVASVLGREWADADAAALAGVDRDACAAQLAAATEAGLLTVRGPARHAFAHVLLRDQAYAALSPSRRAALHAAAGERLAASGDLASGAHHMIEAGDRVHGPRVALEAARAELARLAFEQADRVATRALAFCSPDGEEAGELQIVSAEALIRMGETDRGREAAMRAADRAKKQGRPLLLARAALAYGDQLAPPNIDPLMVGLLRDALAMLDPEAEPDLCVRIQARLASALTPPSTEAESLEARRWGGKALAAARDLGDDTRLYALRFAATALGFHSHTDERLAFARETLELAQKLDRSMVLIDRGPWCALVLREHGCHPESQATLDAWLRLVREFPQPHYRWRPPLVLATHATLDGDFERADRLADESLAIMQEGSLSGPMLNWATQRVSMALLRGDPGKLAHEIERMAPIFDRFARLASWAATMVALAHSVAGRVEAARERMKRAPIESYNPISSMMSGHMAVLVGDDALAASLLDGLIERRKRLPFFLAGGGIAVFGPASRIAAEMALRVGRTEEARGLLEEAIADGERIASPPMVALACSRLAELSGGAASVRARKESASPAQPTPATPRLTIELIREGEVWRLRASSGAEVVLEDRKGLHYLAELVRAEGRELHVSQLAELVETPGDAGAVLDAKAKEAYRRRLEDLRDTLEEARRFGDAARAERAESEMDALADQLAGAVGLGGRDRAMGSRVERARVNVQRRLKDVIRRVEEQEPALGRYLAASVKTGTWCSFTPV
jgi:tetratricopeptide (TPR) repeat protein